MSPCGTVVFAPRDCLSEAAQRARRLGDFLGERRVAYRTADEVEFSNVQSAEQMQRTLAVMNGPVPVVFVNGRAKANPTPAEVLAELGRKG